MTEQEWLTEQPNPQGLVWQFHKTPITRTKRGRRKLRLFAVGCCRRFWAHLRDTRLQQAVTIAESFADGAATKQELESCHVAVEPLQSSNRPAANGADARELTAASMISGLTAPEALDAAFAMTSYELPLAGYCGSRAEEAGTICAILRDVFGNRPLDPLPFAPEWRTGTATALAQQMYESRDFSVMPILADALQDAGCDNADILTHCRDPQQVHVRGCWVVDLVLGKA